MPVWRETMHEKKGKHGRRSIPYPRPGDRAWDRPET